MHRPMRRARTVTLIVLAVNGSTALFLPAIGLWREPRPAWVILGAAGILAFSVAQAFVLRSLVTPWLDSAARRRSLVCFATVSLASLLLVAPMGGGWPSWAWLAACIVGVLPVIAPRWPALLLAVSVGFVAALTAPGRAVDAVVISLGVGAGIAVINGLQVWFWELLVQAEEGRGAQARLAATEERLRFARDVHDVLGHHLSVIALKAELAERLATVDGDRARAEAAAVRRLAASAVSELREVVHGYRIVDLRDELTAVEQILRSSGVRCSVTSPEGELPDGASAPLSAVLREATTNVLRHSRATWCTVSLSRTASDLRMTVTNDGVHASGGDVSGGDKHSSGLRGLAERLAESGGVLRTSTADGWFTLEAVVPASS